MEYVELNKKIGRVGPLTVEIVGDGVLYDRFCDEIQSSKIIAEAIDLSVVVSEVNFLNKMNGYVPTYSSAKKHMSFNKNSFFYDQPVPFLCENLFNEGGCKIYMNEVNNFSLKGLLKKMTETAINSRVEISYSLFWYVIQILLIRKKCSFIHAGVFSENYKATAFMGTGGSGKTSTMFQCLSRRETKYLAEDFGIIRNDGLVYLSPKTLSIYSSDIFGNNSILYDLQRSMTLVDKIKWKINKQVRSRNPMIKVPVFSFFEPEKISDDSILEQAFFITRCKSSKPSLESLKPEEVADRLTNVTLREMKKLVELLNLIKANAPFHYRYPSLEDFVLMIKSVYLGAFKDRNTFLLNVPFEYSPHEVQGYLISKGFL